nr:hypothetical protein [Vibrio parahaemolyticus]
MVKVSCGNLCSACQRPLTRRYTNGGNCEFRRT